MKIRSLHAFSLIELTAVLAILSILAVLVTGTLGSTKSLQLSIEADALTATLNQSRAEAVTRNATTELRLYTSPDSDAPNRMQLLLVKEDGKVIPLTKLQTLPQGIVISSVAEFSGILNLPVETVPDQFVPDATYRGIRFGSRGEPRDLSGNLLKDPNNFLTLIHDSPGGRSTELAANWITLRIDDRTGLVRRYQP